MRFPTVIFIFIIGVIIAQTAFYFPILPAMVASHFNAAGIADRWMPKEGFLIFEAVILLFVIAHYTILPLIIEKMPDAIINLPNKKYWLEPERRAETFAKIRKFLQWFSVGLLTLILLVNQQVFKANLMRQNVSPLIIWTIIGSFVIFAIVWMIIFVRKFKIKI